MSTTKNKPGQAHPASFGSPADGYFYQLQIAGVDVGYFTEVLHVGTGHEVIQGQPTPTEKSAGRRFSKAIILKRPFDGDSEIWEWRRDIENGNVQYQNAALIAYDENGTETARWNITRSWPSRLATEFDPNGAGYEVIHMSFDELTRAN